MSGPPFAPGQNRILNGMEYTHTRYEIMISSTYKKFRAAIRQAIRSIAPKGGFFDTIFDSYDDWRELQDEKRTEYAKKDSPKPDSEA
jgi:hypothetical protein